MRLNPQKPYAQYTEEEKIKQRARMIANRAKRAGVLVPEPCKCGELKVQMHHDDYSKPLEIVWICKICHAKHHKNENMVKKEPLLAL